MDERQPDHTQDPSGTGMSDQQPEEAPAGQIPTDGAEQGPQGDDAKPPAPSRGNERDSDARTATGNPHAAG